MPKLDPDWAPLVDQLVVGVAKQLRENPPPVHKQSPWLNPEQAAEYLGLARLGLENMRRNKRGPRFYRHGHKIVRYNVKDLDAWWDSAFCGPDRAAVTK